MKKIIAGIILSLVVMMTLGTVALAAPDITQTPCIVWCTPVGTGICGVGANNVAQGLLDSGPGASIHARATLGELYP